MPADLSGPVPHVPAVDLAEVLRAIRDQLVFAVDEPTAGRMLSCSAKTVSRLPGHKVGRFKLGTAVRYSVERLRQYVAEQVGDTAVSVATCESGT